jgi:hypothetical protein
MIVSETLDNNITNPRKVLICFYLAKKSIFDGKSAMYGTCESIIFQFNGEFEMGGSKHLAIVDISRTR